MRSVDYPRRRWPWALLAIVLLVLGADQTYRLSMHRRVAAELQALRKEGYPTDAIELRSWERPVPDKQNAALRITEASEYAALGANAFNQEFPTRSQELSAQERDALREMLTNNAPALEALHEAARLSDSLYPVDYSRGPATLVPHLPKIKSLTLLLRANTLLNSEEGRPDVAIQAILDSVALTRSLDREPLLISQLVRIACLSITCSSLERVLTQHALSDAQLAALGAAFKGLSDASVAAFQSGYIGELCLGAFVFRAPAAQLLSAFDSETEVSALPRALFPLYAWTGLRDRDFLYYLRMMHQSLESSKLALPASLARFNAISDEVEHTMRSDRLIIFSRMLLPSLQRAANKAAEAEARVRCVQAALAVEQYRTRHNGSVPDQLGSLGLTGAGALPVDPIDGAPLRYRKLKLGYVIYSIGVDRNDDGGSERFTGGRKKGVHGQSPQDAQPNTRGASNAAKGYDITFTVER